MLLLTILGFCYWSLLTPLTTDEIDNDVPLEPSKSYRDRLGCVQKSSLRVYILYIYILYLYYNTIIYFHLFGVTSILNIWIWLIFKFMNIFQRRSVSWEDWFEMHKIVRNAIEKLIPFVQYELHTRITIMCCGWQQQQPLGWLFIVLLFYFYSQKDQTDNISSNSAVFYSPPLISSTFLLCPGWVCFLLEATQPPNFVTVRLQCLTSVW